MSNVNLDGFFGTKGSIKQEGPGTEIKKERHSIRNDVRRSYVPPPIEDLFDDKDLDADLVSLDCTQLLHQDDKNRIKSLLEKKTMERTLQDELGQMQLRMNSNIPKRQTVITSSDETGSSDTERDDEMKVKSPKKFKVDFFQSIPKLETTDISQIHVGEKKPFNYFQMLSRQASRCSTSTQCEVVGAPNCLLGLTLVFTGEFVSMGREQIEDLAKKHGAKVTGAPSGRTSFLVFGTDPGPGKIEKARKLKLELLSETQFYNMVRKLPARTDSGEVQTDIKTKPIEQKCKAPSENELIPIKTSNLWTLKYAPRSLDNLIGNQAQIQKLRQWLQEWKKKGASGVSFKAALISGPPGIGKSSAANLVALAEGYYPLEFNASDTRSKKSLKNQVQDLLDNQNIFKRKKEEKETLLIMDEVDGMSAGDRGGMAELIIFLKKTRVPIVCICNDRSNIKIRSLATHCLDIRFRRPEARHIVPRLAEICRKEGLSVGTSSLESLISLSHGDIRQVFNLLNNWSITQTSLSYDEAKLCAEKNQKDLEKGPFDVVAELFSSRIITKNINQIIDLYFIDSALIPLMVQENYLFPLIQSKADVSILEKASLAADQFSLSDLVDSRIHGANQLWTLAPFHALLTCLLPLVYCGSGIGGRIEFASWLGHNSKSGKNTRLLAEISTHLALHISGGKAEVRREYVPALVFLLISRLTQDGMNGIDQVISYLDSYTITKEDYDTLVELSVGKYGPSVVNSAIPPAIKSALTRQYNKESHQMPYAQVSVKNIRGYDQLAELVEENPEVIDDETLDGEEDDLAKDKMIKPKIKIKPKRKQPSITRKKNKIATKCEDSYDDGDGFVISDSD